MATTAPVTARTTRQGRAVEQVLADADTFLSAQDIYVALRDNGEGVGLATVYRHLQKLSDTGALDAVTGADGELVYRQCGSRHHHHHLVCRSCRRSTELESAEFEQWAARQAAHRGYTDVEHTVEIFGTCATCRGASPAARIKKRASS
jgi:Fur family transcriptional regulator, ferric uptake regulator